MAKAASVSILLSLRLVNKRPLMQQTSVVYHEYLGVFHIFLQLFVLPTIKSLDKLLIEME